MKNVRLILLSFAAIVTGMVAIGINAGRAARSGSPAAARFVTRAILAEALMADTNGVLISHADVVLTNGASLADTAALAGSALQSETDPTWAAVSNAVTGGAAAGATAIQPGDLPEASVGFAVSASVAFHADTADSAETASSASLAAFASTAETATNAYAATYATNSGSTASWTGDYIGNASTARETLGLGTAVLGGDLTAEQSVPTNKIHILIMGQSQAAGNPLAYPTYPSSDFLNGITNGYATLWTDYILTNGVIKTAYTNITAGKISATMSTFGSSPGAAQASKWSWEIPGSRALRALWPSVTIYVTKYAVGGTSLEGDWKKSAGSLYTNIVPAVASTTNQWPAAGMPDVVWWSQGESDGGSDAAKYETNLTQFISDVRTDLGNTNMAWVITGFGPGSQSETLLTVQAAGRAVAAADPLIEWVGMSDLQTVGQRDGSADVHFSEKGIEEGARRIVEATYRLYAKYRVEGGLAVDNLSAQNIAAHRVSAYNVDAGKITWRGRDLNDDLRAARPEPISKYGLLAYWGEPVAGQTNIVDWTRTYPATLATNAPTVVFDTDCNKSAWQQTGAGISYLDFNPTTISPVGVTNMTLFARVKRESGSASGLVLGSRSSGYGIGIGYSTDKVVGYPAASGNAGLGLASLPTNAFVHVCLVLDGTAGKALLYANGVLVRENAYTYHAQTSNLRIGSTTGSGNRPSFRWTEMGVFNRALSADEVERLAHGARIEGIYAPYAAVGSETLDTVADRGATTDKTLTAGGFADSSGTLPKGACPIISMQAQAGSVAPAANSTYGGVSARVTTNDAAYVSFGPLVPPAWATGAVMRTEFAFNTNDVNQTAVHRVLYGYFDATNAVTEGYAAFQTNVLTASSTANSSTTISATPMIYTYSFPAGTKRLGITWYNEDSGQSRTNDIYLLDSEIQWK